MKRVDLTLWVDPLEPQLSGVGRYTLELARGLATRSEIGRLAYFGRERLVPDPIALVRAEPLPPIRRRYGRLQARWEKRRLRKDLMHGPNFFLPAFAERGIITVHDLSVLKFPETHPRERLEEYDRHFQRSIADARHVITVSETIRQEVIAELGVAADRVSTVYNGVSSAFRPHNEDELLPVLRTWGLRPGAYGLCVAAIEPRKKLMELLAAWRDLPLQLRTRYPLVIAGVPGWRNERIRQSIDQGVAEGWLKAIGFVPELDLPALYGGAALFTYPSIYEGFGLPPIEAMASGVPVIVANRSCLPEICGDAACFIDPDDQSAFTQAIRAGLEDEIWRSGAVERGLRRAAAFSWERCVDGTIDAYRKALASS